MPPGVQVHGPAAVGDGIIEVGLLEQVLLAQDVIADDAPAFALAGQQADLVEDVVLGAVIAAVLDVVPQAEGDLPQFVADRLAVGDGVVDVAADLDPPEADLEAVAGVGAQARSSSV